MQTQAYIFNCTCNIFYLDHNAQSKLNDKTLIDRMQLPLHFSKQKGSNINVFISYRYLSFCVFLRAAQVGLEMKYGVSNNGLFRGEVVTPVCNLEPPSHQPLPPLHLVGIQLKWKLSSASCNPHAQHFSLNLRWT